MAAASERPPGARAPTATVSSLKSEDSTEQLIGKPKVKKIKSVRSVTTRSVEAGGPGGGGPAPRGVAWLGLAQLVLGALLAGAGALALARGAALARAGAGLWAGAVGVLAGVVGLLAAINDCYSISPSANGSPLLTAFLALSLLSVACANGAAVLAATGLQRDTQRARPPLPSFQDEMEAWSPVLSNIALLIIALAQCVAGAGGALAAARRVCACLRARTPFDHNTFEPAHQPAPAHKARDELDAATDEKGRELARQLEGKLAEPGKKKDDSPEYGSANSKEKLVTRWLGHHQGAPGAAPAPVAVPARGGAGSGGRRRPAGVRKARQPPPVVLVPAHPASTLGRVAPCVMVGPRYATLPLPPAPYGPHAPHGPHGPHPPLYYPVHDTRARRRRSPREHRERRRREGRERERESQLTRSLERIHRKRRAERDRLTDADLKRTYTGLDRAYAEQFIAVIDETRTAAERLDSLASTSATSDTSRTTHS